MTSGPVERPKILETTALGTAFLASLGTGVYAQRRAARTRATEAVERSRAGAAT